LHDTGPSDGEESSGQRLTALGLVPEADFSPLDCWAYSTLGGVVGRFHSLMIHEGEQVVPMLEEPSGSTCHIVIRGQLVGLKTIADSCPYGDRFCDKRPPVYMPVFEGMPEGKQATDFSEHPSCEPHAIRTPARMFEPFKVPDDMSPTDLSFPLVVCVVGREHIRTDDPVEDFAEDSFKHFCSPGGYQREECHGRGHENPKPDPLAHTFPARLVHIEDVLFGQSLFDFFTAWFKGLRDFLMKFAHGAEGDVNPKNGPSKLLTAPSGHPMHSGKVGQKSSKPGTEAGSSLRRDIRPCDGTAGTFQTTQLVFGDVRFDLGNLYHLATKVIAQHTAAIHARVKRFVTNLTRLGKNLLDQINLLNGNQIPVRPLVTRLTSRLAMPGFLAASYCRSA